MTTDRQWITTDSEAAWLAERTKDLTSTDIAALFGLSPYRTAFELWHEKRAGTPVKIAENDRMKWGRRLEAVVAQGIAEDRGWTVAPMKDYCRLTNWRVGSSFDFRIDGEKPAILEIKTVDQFAFRSGWIVESDWIEAPAHIELQVQHQMLVSGLSEAYIGVLIGGNRIEVLHRQADADVHGAILLKAREFWSSIEAGKEPDPVMPQDAAALIRLRQYAEPGTLMDLTGNNRAAQLAHDYVMAAADEKAAAEAKESARAELLELIGDSEKAILPGGIKLSASMTAGRSGTLITTDMVGTVIGATKGYRSFRLTVPKEKA